MQLGAVGALASAVLACGGTAPGAAARAAGEADETLPVEAPSAPQDATVTSVQPPAPGPVAAVANRPEVPLLERIYTGQEQPSVVVDNGYPQAQHLFVDARWLGRVDPGSSASFEVPLGVHTFTSADSSDPNDNPSSVTEPFEAGYRYQYAIRAR